MGVAGLRDAFNSVASPRYVASMAFLANERSDGKEWSRLTFRGIGSDGTTFEVASEHLLPGSDVIVGAKQTAKKLIEGSP